VVVGDFLESGPPIQSIDQHLTQGGLGGAEAEVRTTVVDDDKASAADISTQILKLQLGQIEGFYSADVDEGPAQQFGRIEEGVTCYLGANAGVCRERLCQRRNGAQVPRTKATPPGNGEIDKPLNALLVAWLLQHHRTELSRVEVRGHGRCRGSILGWPLPWLEIAQDGAGANAGNRQDQKSPY